jgi:hypothetical protein
MKKLKQTLGKEEPKKSKNLNLSTTIPSIKRIKNQTNPTYLYVPLLIISEIPRKIDSRTNTGISPY